MPYDFQLKIDWANQRIRDLEEVINLWIDTNPYGIDAKIDADTREKKYFATKIPDIPPEFSIRAGEIIQHLRSALDYLAWALVKSKGTEPTDHTGFPIFKSWPLTRDQHRTFSKRSRACVLVRPNTSLL